MYNWHVTKLKMNNISTYIHDTVIIIVAIVHKVKMIADIDFITQ